MTEAVNPSSPEPLLQPETVAYLEKAGETELRRMASDIGQLPWGFSRERVPMDRIILATGQPEEVTHALVYCALFYDSQNPRPFRDFQLAMPRQIFLATATARRFRVLADNLPSSTSIRELFEEINSRSKNQSEQKKPDVPTRPPQEAVEALAHNISPFPKRTVVNRPQPRETIPLSKDEAGSPAFISTTKALDIYKITKKTLKDMQNEGLNTYSYGISHYFKLVELEESLVRRPQMTPIQVLLLFQKFGEQLYRSGQTLVNTLFCLKQSPEEAAKSLGWDLSTLKTVRGSALKKLRRLAESVDTAQS